MGVFKEEAHIFENIARKQTRIYNDAADFGYPYNTEKVPSEVTAVFETLAQLKAMDAEFPKERPLVRNRQTWEGGVSVDVIIFWEKDEGYYCGTKYTITFNKIGTHSSRLDKESNAFISVYCDRYKEKI